MPIKVTGSITEGGEGTPLGEAFRNGNGLPADGLEAFFPILRMSETDRWAPPGTGFFISNNGLFVTARLVLTDRATGDLLTSLGGVQIVRRDNRAIIREIIKVNTHPSFDLAVGFLVDRSLQERGIQTVNKCFCLTTSVPSVGQRIVTFALPRPMASGESGRFQLLFTTSGIFGEVQECYPNGRDTSMLPGPCYRTSMSTAGGASGAPVAFTTGCVFALVTSGVPDQPISFASSIAPILDLEVHHLRLPTGEIRDTMTIRELASIGLVNLTEQDASA